MGGSLTRRGPLGRWPMRRGVEPSGRGVHPSGQGVPPSGRGLHPSGRGLQPLGWQFSHAAVLARETTAVLLGPLFRWWLEGPTVKGAEHLGELEPPTIICPTHASHVDSSALRLALGRRHRRRLAAAAAADYFAISRERWFVAAWLGAFAFDRSGHGGPESMVMAERLLAEGWNVLVYPEGTRSITGQIGPFRPGVGLIAARTGRQVLPVRIVGSAAVLPKGARWPHRAHVEVRFGRPLRVEPGEDPRAFTARLEAAVRAL